MIISHKGENSVYWSIMKILRNYFKKHQDMKIHRMNTLDDQKCHGRGMNYLHGSNSVIQSFSRNIYILHFVTFSVFQ